MTKALCAQCWQCSLYGRAPLNFWRGKSRQMTVVLSGFSIPCCDLTNFSGLFTMFWFLIFSWKLGKLTWNCWMSERLREWYSICCGTAGRRLSSSVGRSRTTKITEGQWSQQPKSKSNFLIFQQFSSGFKVFEYSLKIQRNFQNQS